jgi:hypothetical protein
MQKSCVTTPPTVLSIIIIFRLGEGAFTSPWVPVRSKRYSFNYGEEDGG